MVVMALIRPFNLSDMKMMVFSHLLSPPFRAPFSISINHILLLSVSLLTIENTIWKMPLFPSFVVKASSAPPYLPSRSVPSTNNIGQQPRVKPCSYAPNEKNAFLKLPSSLSTCTVINNCVYTILSC